MRQSFMFRHGANGKRAYRCSSSTLYGRVSRLIGDMTTLRTAPLGNGDGVRESFGERFRRLRLAAGLSIPQVAELLGITRQAVSMVESGATKSLGGANLVKAAEIFNVTPSELLHGVPSMRSVLIKGVNAICDIPIIGFVIATPDQDGFFDDMDFPTGVGEGYVPWATRDPNAYAVRVKGDSMQPRFRPGEIVVVEPGAATIPGDDVIIRTKAGRKMVKRLLFQRGQELTLGSVNDRHPLVTISLEEIESIHHIAGSVQRGTATQD